MSVVKNIILLGAFAGAAVVATGLARMNGAEADAQLQQTDDAYIKADFTLLAPQISGVITDVLVADNMQVKAGDVLFRIDDREARIALESAQAAVSTAQAAIHVLDTRIRQNDLTVKQAEATIVIDKAAQDLAISDVARYTNLAKEGSGTAQALQEAQTKAATASATLSRDEAGLLLASQQIDVLSAQKSQAEAGLASANAHLSSAMLDLSYTEVKAPVSGTISQNNVRKGAFADKGRALLAIVPLQKMYIEADFRETQLAHIAPGQQVEFSVDALPQSQFKGHVESLGPASGVSFSAIPAHNATGNFTRIVQRLPVRIAIDPGQSDTDKLRVGMSVQPSVHVSDVKAKS